MIYFTMIADFAGTPHAAFFDDNISAPASIPAAAISISAKRHAALLAAQAGGAVIEPCTKTGKPLVKRPPRDPATLRAALIGQVKGEAGRRIRTAAPPWRQTNDAIAFALGAADAAAYARLAQVTAIREASGQIEDQIAQTAAAELAQFPVSTHPLWPQISSAQGTQ